MLLKFVDASPAQNQAEREILKAEATSHAARISHQRRRRAEDAISRPLMSRRAGKLLALPSVNHVLPHNMLVDQSWLPSTRSRSPETTSTVCKCETCLYQTNSLSCLGRDNESELDDKREWCDTFQGSTAIPGYPTTRPEWTQEDITDLQFFREIFGAGVRSLSDSGFFNVVLPCLVEFDIGIRNLVLAVSSTYRLILSSPEAERPDANVRALEKCNKGIKHLAKDSALTPPEVALASCVLMATWYMFRLDSKAAAVCARAAEKISHMDGKVRLESRILSARNATDTQPGTNTSKSTFSKIILGTVAKLALELLNNRQDFPLSTDMISVRLDLSSEGLRFRIRDLHDLLSSVEVFAPMFQQLRANVSYHAHLDSNTNLAQDLLNRLDLIAIKLRRTPYQPGRIATVVEILWQWHRYYSIGIRCQLLSSSEMSWDEHSNDFLMLTEWSERHLSQMQEDKPYMFLPIGIIVQPLWFTAVHCRDHDIRHRAITVLLKYHRNEAGLDSWIAGQVAQQLMHLEEKGRDLHLASDVQECDRVLLRGFEADSKTLYLLYSYATEVEMLATATTYRQPLAIPKDPHGVVQMWEQSGHKVNQLQNLALSIGQVAPESAPLGSFVPIYYDEQFVEVLLPEYTD